MAACDKIEAIVCMIKCYKLESVVAAITLYNFLFARARRILT